MNIYSYDSSDLLHTRGGIGNVEMIVLEYIVSMVFFYNIIHTRTLHSIDN